MPDTFPEEWYILKAIQLVAITSGRFCFPACAVRDQNRDETGRIGFNTAGHAIDTAAIISPDLWMSGHVFLLPLLHSWELILPDHFQLNRHSPYGPVQNDISGPWGNQVFEPSRQSGLAALQMAACLNAERLNFIFLR